MDGDLESRPAAECLITLSTDVVEYSEEELELIRISKTDNEDGSKRRTTVHDMDGCAYTLPGQQRHDGDFTMPSSYPLHALPDPVNQQYWIRAPKEGEAPEFRGGWFVIDRRRFRLVHPNSKPIRYMDTIGMFPGSPTISPDLRKPRDIKDEAALQAAEKPGIYDSLIDDIKPGVSPR